MTHQSTTEKTQILFVTLLGQDYPIKCPADQTEKLQECVALLNEKLEITSKKMPKASRESLLVLTALNLTHELLYSAVNNENERFQNLLQKLNQVLSDTHEKNTILKVPRRADDS